jgi:hypothetical protein
MHENDPVHQAWLESLIADVQGVAGTVHVQSACDLLLTAAHNIPPEVLRAVKHVPQGKGMAGLAQIRKEAVQTCDLQNDESGQIRPRARAVDAQAAIAVPVLDDEGEVFAVIGIAWAHAGDVSPATEQLLAQRAQALLRTIA